MQGEYVLSQNEIVIKRNERNQHFVHTPFKHEQFVRALKTSCNKATWNETKQQWFIPADRVEWVKELVAFWFKLPVVVKDVQ